MEFKTYESFYCYAKKRNKSIGIDWYYDFLERDREAPQEFREVWPVERRWLKAKRPYYSIFPLALKSLLAMDLDIPAKLISLPLPSLLVRFPAPQKIDIFKDGKTLINTFLVHQEQDGLRIVVDFDQYDSIKNKMKPQERFAFKVNTQTNETITNSFFKSNEKPWLSSSQQWVKGLHDPVIYCLKIACSLCLLADDPDIIKPDVLNEHRRQFDETKDQKYVERAHKRGKVGWLVGADWETCPHYRRPHLAIRWTEKGRTVPKIVNVRGTTVHRTKLSDVPTGYLDDDENTKPK